MVGEVAKGAKQCLSIPKDHSTGLQKTSVRSKPGHHHTLLAGLELVLRDNMASNRTTMVIPVFRVVSMEWNDKGNYPERSL